MIWHLAIWHLAREPVRVMSLGSGAESHAERDAVKGQGEAKNLSQRSSPTVYCNAVYIVYKYDVPRTMYDVLEHTRDIVPPAV